LPNKVVSLEDRLPKLKEQRRKRANRRLIILLFFFFLFVCGFIYIQSPLSRVGELTIDGNHFASKEKIVKASKLTNKSIVLNMKKSTLEHRILQVPEVKKVKIDMKFPNHIIIKVEEYRQIGFLYIEGQAKPLLENGHVTRITSDMTTQPGPVLKSFDKDKPLQMTIKELKAMPDEIRQLISEIIYSPKNTDPYSIIAFMNDGNEVHATLRTFAEKMVYYPDLVKQLQPEEKGIVDLEVGVFFKSYQSIKNGDTKNDEPVNDKHATEESGEENEN